MPNDIQNPNKDFEGVDKAPGEEQGKSEKVTTRDLKGKKGNGDPSIKQDQPVKQNEPGRRQETKK